MKLLTKNFGALEGLRTFEFLPGINALVGPNGCGKSTVVNALFMSITGDPINRRNLDDLITWGHSTASVEFIGDGYSVVRELTKGKNSKVKFTRGDTELTRKAEVDDEGILTLFNIGDKSQFRHVYFTEQFKATDLFDGADSKRLEMLFSLLGFGKFERFRDTIAQLCKLVFVDKVSSTLIDSMSSHLSEYKERAEGYKEQIAQLLSDVIPEDQLAAITAIANAYPKEEYDSTKADFETAVTRVKQLEQQLNDLPEPVNTASDDYAKAYRYTQLLPEFTAAEAAMQAFESGVSPSSRQLRELKSNLVLTKGTLDFKIEDMHNRAKMVAGGTCPLTGGDLCADLARMTDPVNMEATLNSLRQQLAELQADMDSVDALIATADEQESKMVKARSEYDKLKAMIEPLKEYADFDIAAYEDAAKNQAEIGKIRATLYEQLGNLKRQVTVFSEALTEAENKTTASKLDIATAQELIEKHRVSALMLKELDRSLAEALDSLAKSEDSINKALEQNKDADTGLAAIELLNKVRSLLHKDNLPRLLISEAREELNKRLKLYLDWFEFPYVVSWDANGGINFVNDIGELTPASALSGGQQYILAIANRCAAADLLDTTFPLMVLDEPTTGLDDKNRELLAEMLYKVSDVLSQRGLTLVIPTHDEALLSNANVIHVG